MVIKARGVTKVYRIRREAPGLWSRVKGMFRPVYETKLAVKDLDLSVADGEAVAFIGPNGAGKSTTIKLLTGLLHPTKGDIRINGLVPWHEREQLAYQIGLVFGQKSQLWYHLPPRDAFELLGRIYEVEESEHRAWLGELIEVFDLGKLLDVPVRKLSLGQRIKCEIAAALIHKPKLLFLDEPTIGLDVVARQVTRDLIRRVNERGTTVFLASHDPSDLESICSRAIVLNNGSIVFDNSVDSLKDAYMTTKAISLKLGVERITVNLNGVRVLKESPYAVQLEVDCRYNSVHMVTGRLLQEYPVLDLSVTAPSMERVITAIYREQTAREERANA